MSQVGLSAWNPPRPQPEILPATIGQAREYTAWFVNRRAYTRQTDRPDEQFGKYYFYQARNRQTKERLALDDSGDSKASGGRADHRSLCHQPGDPAIEMGRDRRRLRRSLPGSQNAQVGTRTGWSVRHCRDVPPRRAPLDSVRANRSPQSYAVSIYIISPSGWTYRSRERSSRSTGSKSFLDRTRSAPRNSGTPSAGRSAFIAPTCTGTGLRMRPATSTTSSGTFAR